MSMIGAVELLMTVRDEITPQLQDLDAAVRESEDNLETLAQKVTYAFGQATRAVGETAQEAENSMKRWATGITVATMAFDAMQVAVAKMAVNVNASLANTTALMTDFSDDAIPGIVNTMRSGSQDMSITFGKSTTDMTQGLYDVVSSLGYTSASMKQLEISAKAGAAGVATTGQAFLGLSSITKAYGDTSEAAFTKAADIMFETVNRGVVTFPQLSNVIGQVGTYAAKLNVPLEEVGAVIATLSGVTGNASEVTTQMISAMTALINPTEKLQALYKKWGYESGSAAVAQLGLAGTLQKVVQAAGNDEAALIKLLRRKEAYILTTALAGKQSADFAQKMQFMAAAGKSAGDTLNKAFQRQTQGVNAVGFAWEQFKQKGQVALEKLGQLALLGLGPLVTLLNMAMNAGLGFVNMLSQWPKTVATVVGLFEILARIISVVLFVLGTITGIAGAAIAALGSIVMSIALWGLMKVAITFVIGLLFQYGTAVLSAGAASATFGLITGQSVNYAKLAMTSLMSPLETVKSGFALLQNSATAMKWGAWSAGALAAGAAGAVLGRMLLETGDKMRGLDDPIRTGIQNTGLLEGAWYLITNAFANGSQIMQNLKDALSTVSFELGYMGGILLDIVASPFKGMAIAASQLGDLIYELGRKMYGISDAGILKANVAWAAQLKIIKELNENALIQRRIRMAATEPGKGIFAPGAVDTANPLTDANMKAKLLSAKDAKTLESAQKAAEGLGITITKLADAKRFLALQTETSTAGESKAAAAMKKSATEASAFAVQLAKIDEKIAKAQAGPLGPVEAAVAAINAEAEAEIRAADAKGENAAAIAEISGRYATLAVIVEANTQKEQDAIFASAAYAEEQKNVGEAIQARATLTAMSIAVTDELAEIEMTLAGVANGLTLAEAKEAAQLETNIAVLRRKIEADVEAARVAYLVLKTSGKATQADADALGILTDKIEKTGKLTEAEMRAAAGIEKTTKAAAKAKTASDQWVAVLMSLSGALMDVGGSAFAMAGMVVGAFASAKQGYSEYKQAQAGSEEDKRAQKMKATANAVGEAGAIWRDNAQNLSKWGAAANGAMRGAAAGAQFGPIGAIVGGLAGALIGVFSGSGFRKMAKEAGSILGFEISAELAKAIQATMKDLDIDVEAATLLNLDKAIDESGKAASTFAPQIDKLLDGIKDKSIPAKEGIEVLKNVIQQLATEGGADAMVQLGKISTDVFGMMKNGQISVKEGSAMIGTAFSAMVAEVESGSGLASDAMRGIIAASIATGQKIKEVSDYIGSLADQAAPALEARFKTLGPETENLGTKMDTLGRITAATFQAMLFAGDSIVEIFDALGPALDQAMRIAEESGVALTGRLAEMASFRNLIEENRELVDSVSGTTAIIKLAAAGFGDMKDAVSLVTDDYKALTEAGFSESQALALQAPALKQLDELRKRGLVSLDAETAARIENARAAGLLDATPQEAMAEATQQLVVLMGALVQEMGVALPAAIAASIAKWNELNSVASGTPTGGPPPPAGPPEPPEPPKGYQYGFFSPELPSNRLVQLHAGERVEVTPASQTRNRNMQEASNRMGFVLQPGAISISGVSDPRQAAEEVVRLMERRLMPRFDTALSNARGRKG